MSLPLSLGILINYFFQRGLTLFAKTPLAPPSLGQGLSYYFIAAGIIIAFIGLLCDNMNSRKIFLWSAFCGAASLLCISSAPLAFGILMGAATAVARISPNTAPMKVLDKNLGMSLVPQGMAKSLAGIIMPIVMGFLLMTVGWNWAMPILAAVYIVIGFLVYALIPDDYVRGWNIRAIPEWRKDWEVWAFLVTFISTIVAFYVGMKQFIPSLVATGASMVGATAFIASVSWFEFAARPVSGWLGDRIGYGKVFHASLMLIVAYLLISVIPWIAIPIIMIGSGIQTPSMFPLVRRLVGKANVATLFGIGYCIASILTGLVIK
jgi:nitrate/nitrite transporter NarK